MKSLYHANGSEHTRITRGSLWLWLICASCGLAQIDSSVPLPIPPGLAYSHTRTGVGPLSIHILKIDRANPQFKFTTSLAQNTVLGLQPLSQQVKAISRSGHKPVAAVNGDFFRIRSGPYQGDPLGLQILNGELISSPGRVCFWLDTQQHPHVAPIQANFQATWPDGTSVAFAVNQAVDKGHAVLYSPCMGQSTRTDSGVELVLGAVSESPWLPIRPGQIYRARILAVNHDANSTIPSDKLILSLSPSVVNAPEKLTVGTVLSLSLKTMPDLTHVETAISGGPLLITNRTKQTFSPNQPGHPRTAIGWNAEQYFLVVVDGRQKGLSVGITLPDLAEMMLNLGCTDALNLDGGGSSTLWVAGSIMNSPSDKQERRIANGLILLHD